MTSNSFNSTKIALIKASLFTITFSLLAISPFAQSKTIKAIEKTNPPQVALAPLNYLASDQLMGRGLFRSEIDTAADYISSIFKKLGLKELAGTKDYFQVFDLKILHPASKGSLSVGGTDYQFGRDFLQLRASYGKDLTIEAPIVYVADGKQEDFDKANVKGKIVVTDIKTTAGSVAATKIAKEAGAIALIARMEYTEENWQQSRHVLGEDYILREPAIVFPVYMLNDPQKTFLSSVNKGGNGKLSVTGNTIKSVGAKNVMGYVEGTDKNLKSQYVLLSAHYDHIGVASKPKMEEGKLDSIYNGARDNAIGTTAVIAAARYFAAHPPKRSVLLIAYTGEEMGLIGSKYFAEHPTVPLKQIVYNLNIDNASYNDTKIVTVVGLGRTTADDDIKKACEAFGLTAVTDPAPEQNLFDRSDNVSLAVKGIPAPTFSLGFTKFDSIIFKRYHQLSDEVGDMDMEYSMKYIKSFVLAAKNIADNPEQPKWKKDDKYEAAWMKLYE